VSGDQPEFGRLPLPSGLSPRSNRRPTFGVRPPRRSHRLLTVVAATLSFVVLATSAFGFGYYQKLNGNIHRVKVFGYTAEKDRPDKVNASAENILLVGSDTRDDLTDAEISEIGTERDGGSINTDTIMLMHISPTNAVTIVSFPRDSFVAIPGHGTFKINSAYADGEAEQKGGGPAKLTQTVENLSGVHIDHYMQVDFKQFISISNAIGGVTVCISNNGKGAHDSFSGIDLPDGYSTIKGAQALAFVRQRHGLPQGDIDRIDRQRRFLTAMIKQVKTIRDPATFNTLLQKVTSSLTVDQGLSGKNLIDLANRLKNTDLGSINFAPVPIANSNASTTINGQNVSYVKLDMAALPAFFAPIINDTGATASATPTASPTPTVNPSAVNVQVLNGRGTTGAATTASTTLKGYGFVVSSTGNADRTATTTIRYGATQTSAAATLAKFIPGAKLVADPTLTTSIVLTLGTDNLSITNPAAVPTTLPSTSAPITAASNPECGI